MTQNTTQNDPYAARQAALFARATTATLITSLRTIVAKQQTVTSRELSLTRIWIIDELERRYPAAARAVEAAFAQSIEHEEATGVYVEINYVEVLIDAIRTTQS